MSSPKNCLKTVSNVKKKITSSPPPPKNKKQKTKKNVFFSFFPRFHNFQQNFQGGQDHPSSFTSNVRNTRSEHYEIHEDNVESFMRKDPPAIKSALVDMHKRWADENFHLNVTYDNDENALSFGVKYNYHKHIYQNIKHNGDLRLYAACRGIWGSCITLTYLGAISKFPYPDSLSLGRKQPISLIRAARHAIWEQSRKSFLKDVFKMIYARDDDKFFFDYFLPVLSLENRSRDQTIKYNFEKIKKILERYQKHLASFTKTHKISIRSVRRPRISRSRPQINTCAILNTLRREMESELGVDAVAFSHDSDFGYFLSYGARNYPD